MPMPHISVLNLCKLWYFPEYLICSLVSQLVAEGLDGSGPMKAASTRFPLFPFQAESLFFNRGVAALLHHNNI